MKIGVDIDDTISCTNKRMIEEALRYDEEYVNGRGFKNKNGETFIEKFYWNVYNVDGFLQKVRKSKFFLGLEVKEQADEYLNKLYQEGHEIYFITRRHTSLGVKLKTKKWLKNNGFKYNNIYFGIVDKGKFCKDNNIDLLIDNDYKNVDQAIKYGVDAILMVDDYNKLLRKYNKVKNWQEIYDYINGVK